MAVPFALPFISLGCLILHHSARCCKGFSQVLFIVVLENFLNVHLQKSLLILLKVHVQFAYSTSIIFSKQSPHIILTDRVARTLWPHRGQITLRVLLGRLPPLGAAPGWAVPVAPVLIAGGRVLRPSMISDQPLFKAYSMRLSPGVVFHP